MEKLVLQQTSKQDWNAKGYFALFSHWGFFAEFHISFIKNLVRDICTLPYFSFPFISPILKKPQQNKQNYTINWICILY